jgi:hypothetical protein
MPRIYQAQGGVWVPLDPSGAASGGSVVPSNVVSVDYVLVLADAGKVLEMDSTSARTITVPPVASVPFPDGTWIELLRYGTGGLTIAAGAGVTIRTSGGLSLMSQYSSALLRKRTGNEWTLAGETQ